MTRKALIVGASGLVGGYCLEALLEYQDYSEIIALVRRPLLKTHRKLRTIVTQFDNLERDIESIQVQDVFCCLGSTIRKAGSQEAFKEVDHLLVIRVAELMKKQGADQFLVVSSIGADKGSKSFYCRTKGDMEEELKEVGYCCLRIFRPSLLLGKRQEFRFGERLAILLTPLVRFLLVGRFKKYRPVEAETVARFMVGRAYTAPLEKVYVYESDCIEV